MQTSHTCIRGTITQFFHHFRRNFISDLIGIRFVVRFFRKKLTRNNNSSEKKLFAFLRMDEKLFHSTICSIGNNCTNWWKWGLKYVKSKPSATTSGTCNNVRCITFVHIWGKVSKKNSKRASFCKKFKYSEVHCTWMFECQSLEAHGNNPFFFCTEKRKRLFRV